MRRKRSLEGIKRKRQQEGAGSDDSEVEDPGMQEDQPEAEESEDEAEYYRQAVGEEPDEGSVTRTCALLSLLTTHCTHLFCWSFV